MLAIQRKNDRLSLEEKAQKGIDPRITTKTITEQFYRENPKVPVDAGGLKAAVVANWMGAWISQKERIFIFSDPEVLKRIDSYSLRRG